MTQSLTAKDAAKQVVIRLKQAGHTAYWAGGCVRDLILRREPKDYDVATSAVPGEIAGLFKRTRKVGMHFGVVIVGVSRHWIEVATFRTDASYSDGRRPDAVTFSTPEEDAQRRDFTINGMFYDPTEDRIIDYVGGQADLQTGIIRAIGDPVLRIQEDRLRMLRAIRFAARLGFEVEEGTFRAVAANAEHLKGVSEERIREELEMLLSDANRQRGFDLLVSTGLIQSVFPEFKFEPTHLNLCHDIIGELPTDCSFTLPLSVLLSGEGSSMAGRTARRLTMSNESREKMAWLIDHQRRLDAPADLDLADLKRLLAQPAFSDLRNWQASRAHYDSTLSEAVNEIQRRIDRIPADTIAPPPLLTGSHLIRMRVPAGPEYKRILDAVYRAQLNEEITSEPQAIALAERLKDQPGDGLGA
jgi:poly(A) polymerase